MKKNTDRPAKVATARAKSPVNSEADVRDGAYKRNSMLLDIFASQFTLKRRSNPSAAFAEMMHRLSAATRDDKDVARAFASFQKHFRGIAVTQEDAIRLDALKKRGAGKLKIKVGSLPSSIAPGLALMYDAALEALRSSDEPIFPELIGAREIRIVERSLDKVLPLIGSASVTALELALDDKQFADHLRQRASEAGTVFLPIPPGPCEFCEIQIKEPDGNISSYCGTKEQCDNLGAIVLILLLVWLGAEIVSWFF